MLMLQTRRRPLAEKIGEGGKVEIHIGRLLRVVCRVCEGLDVVDLRYRVMT
jgi:hypothetical protein